MPELPEVETVRRGVAPHVAGQVVERMVIRQRGLRWPISRALPQAVAGCTIHQVERRAKYLLFDAGAGHILWHLGMSGSMRVLRNPPPPGPHDHVDVCLRNGATLRFRDPRRFGSVHWTRRDPLRHPLLAGLGPEPLGEDFDGAWLHARSRGRSVAVKNFLMDSKVVAGVGNIYASEALFRAGVSPLRAAGRVGAERYERITAAVKAVLEQAVRAGGTTLRDFTVADGEPGYFAQELQVYGREGEACPQCGRPIRCRVVGQRSSFYCVTCQH